MDRQSLPNEPRALGKAHGDLCFRAPLRGAAHALLHIGGSDGVHSLGPIGGMAPDRMVEGKLGRHRPRTQR